jgi:hypothetical protein
MDSTGVAAAAHAITIQLWQLGGVVLLAMVRVNNLVFSLIAEVILIYPHGIGGRLICFYGENGFMMEKIPLHSQTFGENKYDFFSPSPITKQ